MNFCRFLRLDFYADAAAQGLPPPHNSPRPPHEFVREPERGRTTESTLEDAEVDLLEPLSTVGNDQPFIGDRTDGTDVVHENGMVKCNTRGLFQLAYK